MFDPHLGHATPLAAAGAARAGALLPLALRDRGSSATGCPHRAHCGTPIGVNALHASHTRPTSIKRCDSTPLRIAASKNRASTIDRAQCFRAASDLDAA